MMGKLKIYFAGSISGGRQYVKTYEAAIKFLGKFGEVLTKHVGDPNLTDKGQKEPPDVIFERDSRLLDSCDILIAHISQPSLGVGYEIGRAEAAGKPIVCLWEETKEKRFPPMIAGNSGVKIIAYNSQKDLESQLTETLARVFA